MGVEPIIVASWLATLDRPYVEKRIQSILDRVIIVNHQGWDCWIPSQQPTTHGYVHVKIGRKQVNLARFLYSWLVEPISLSFEASHGCDNRPCCNLNHIRPLTIRENQQERQTYDPLIFPCGHLRVLKNKYNSHGGRTHVCKVCQLWRSAKSALKRRKLLLKELNVL